MATVNTERITYHNHQSHKISLALPFCNFKGFYRDLPLILHKLSVALLVVATFPLILDH